MGGVFVRRQRSSHVMSALICELDVHREMRAVPQMDVSAIEDARMRSHNAALVGE